MSVIVGRALPDVRDGLKPVHRRVHLRDVRRRLPPRPGVLQVRAASSATSWVSSTRTVTRRSTTPSCASCSRGALRYPLVARPGQLRLARQRRRRRAAVHRDQDGAARDGDGARHRRGHRRLPGQLRRPHAGAASSCRRASRTCWSTARSASRSAWPPTSRRTTCARSRPARSGTSRTPRPTREELLEALHRAHQGPGLPDRRADPRHQGHRGRLPHRPRLDHDARGRQRRGDPGPHLPRRHRAAVPGQPRQPRASRSPTSSRTARSPASPTSATRPRAAPASASSSCSSATPSPRSC